MEENHTCVFCNQEAHYQFKNGNWCCKNTPSSCREIKRKKALKATGKAKTIDGEIERKRKISQKAKKLNFSSHLKGYLGTAKKGAGRGKHGWYKGYWCDSSWELAWVIFNLEHGIKFERNTQGFEYEFEGKKHKYFPDFRLENGSYVEVKGWLDNKTKVKIASFNGSLTIIGSKEIKPYLEYVVSKYGKSFINLYEGIKKTLSVCSDCGKEISFQSKRCKKCAAKKLRRVERPSKEELEKLVKEFPMTKIGKMFGVSDNAIKKWLKVL